MADNHSSASVDLRVHGETVLPTLVYVPGLHGDWTLVASFRAALKNQVRFIELMYPRTTAWSLADYAGAVLDALRDARVSAGWLLGESFGSQVVWQMLELAPARGFDVQGIILTGGFVRYPVPWALPLAEGLNRRVPFWVLKLLCRCYAFYARFRHARAPETRANIGEFLRRRTLEADRQAICHRYGLIAGYDARPAARQCRVPVFQLYGLFDPIVPWWPVRAWLKRHCSACRGTRLIWRADHTVLATAPRASARAVLAWITPGRGETRD